MIHDGPSAQTIPKSGPANMLVQDPNNIVETLSQSTIDNMIAFLSAIGSRSPLEDNSGSSVTPPDSTSSTDGIATPYVSPIEVRPFPQVVQTTPTAPRKNNSRIGRTRILTDTPEKNQLEDEHRKKEEKEKKREERINKKGAKRVIHPPGKSKTNKKSKRADKENCVPHSDDETDRVADLDGHEEQHQPTTPPRCTRAGRIVRRKKITNV